MADADILILKGSGLINPPQQTIYDKSERETISDSEIKELLTQL